MISVFVGALFNIAAEFYLDGFIGARHEPHITQVEPVIGELHLPAVDYPLFEYAEFVSDGIAGCRYAEGCERIHVARRQSAQTSIAETGIRFYGIDVVNIHAYAFECIRKRFLYAQVIQVVMQRGAHEELHAHVVDVFVALFVLFFGELHVFVYQQVSDDVADCLIYLLFCCVLEGTAEVFAIVFFHERKSFFLVNFQYDHSFQLCCPVNSLYIPLYSSAGTFQLLS